jgi:hypothetical protein
LSLNGSLIWKENWRKEKMSMTKEEFEANERFLQMNRPRKTISDKVGTERG